MSTIAQEILAIATEHGYEGAAQPTIAGAINALADTLAGSDATDGSTIAGAVKALAPYIGGGGGSFGSLQYCAAYVDEGVPEVGDTIGGGGEHCSALAYSGSSPIVISGSDNIDYVAAGIKVCMSASDITTLTGIYAVTIDTSGGHSDKIATVRELTGTGLTIETIEVYGEELPFITWTMPELQSEDEYLYIGYSA